MTDHPRHLTYTGDDRKDVQVQVHAQRMRALRQAEAPHHAVRRWLRIG